MKSFLRRMLALPLCVLLLSTSALASDALGSRIYSYTLDICDNTTLTREVMWSASKSDLRTENYVTYKPSRSVSPKVSYGSSVLARQSVITMARDLEKSGDRVLSGINGDYFVMATGNPLGLVVTDGILRSSASYLHALGFNADGTAVIGTPALTLRADFKGHSLKVSEINKIRDGEGYFLFTDDFGTTTKNTKPGIDVILTPITGNTGKAVKGADGVSLTTSNQLKIGSLVPCRVEQVIDATGATTIAKGKFVLSIIDTGGQWLKDMLHSLQPGDTLNLEVYSDDTRWNNVDCAVGAMYWILADGQVTAGLDASTAAPRTAVGVKPDGSVIFYTIDGRQSGHSVGATIQMVAQRLKELGCRDAILLDGGGSTTMVSTYPDYSDSTLINAPSEGTVRSVTNAIFLVSNLNPTGKLGSLYVTPSSLTLLPGATTQCVATAMDTGWYPMDNLPGQVTWYSPEGVVSDTGLFTAPVSTGRYTVSAAVGGAAGSTTIQVYDTPDSISVVDRSTGKSASSLTLAPGPKVELDASASYRTVGLTGRDECFTWTADPSIGTISSSGTFTAGETTASGKIKVAAGKYAITISVSVKAPSRYTLLSDFEGNDPWFTSSTASLTLSDASSQVKYGTQSLRAAYTLKDWTASLSAAQTLSSADKVLSLWVYGDQSGNTLSASFTDPDGANLTQPLGTLNFSGWKQLSAAVPSGATTFRGLALSGSKASGTIWLDQVVMANQAGWDNTAPKVSLSVNGTSVTAKLTDDAKDALSKDRISLTLDGRPVAFLFDASTGTLTATLPSPGAGLHRVSVTAADPCGNLGQASASLTGTAHQASFADTNGHWAKDYVSSLYAQGIITGDSVNGTLFFYPNQSITRGDFALMTSRWLGIDPEKYSHVSLPYADTAAIPSWNRNAVRALYSLEIMQGSRGNDGLLYANASAPITRAEAMTLLGRRLPKGFPSASLSAFSDASAVPSWSKEHISVLAGLKVVSGSNGSLRPNDSVTRAEVAKLLFTLW